MDYINHEINECFYVMPVTDEETARYCLDLVERSSNQQNTICYL